jgi:hypothetical protein
MTGREVRHMKRALFAVGQIVATPGALRLIAHSEIDPWELLDRHVTGDWGDLSDEDKKENDYSVRRSLRILSAYGTGESKLWIITEGDRSATTILRPDEY